MATLFVGYPSAVLYKLENENITQPPQSLVALKHLLWGDFLTVLAESADGNFFSVFVRGEKGWISKSDTQTNRLLEIVFVDVGQGDGALVVTPNDRRYVIDAGEGDNMYRFLRWRFGFKKKVSFDAAVISHSDSDHYGGFSYLFNDKNVRFKTIYTNGLMERKAASNTKVLGELQKIGKLKYVTALVTSRAELVSFLADVNTWRGKQYPTMFERALSEEKFNDFRMIDVRDKFLPGFEAGKDMTVEVLGPHVESVSGTPGLRWFGDLGKTKNGHSVVCRLLYKNVKIFLGGDLNIESSRLLLEAHTGLSGDPKTKQEEAALIAAANPHFGSDIAKACHHGSADTFLPFIQAINPIATVISSGDDEPHAHPRADALGAIAKSSRGERPLIFSTELSRSTKDVIKQPEALRKQFSDLVDKLAQTEGPQERASIQAKLADLIAKIDRSVAVYGAINLRTDGNKVVLAYKLERSTPIRGWDIYRLAPEGISGELKFQSKFD